MRYDRWQFKNFDTRLNDIDDKILNIAPSKASYVRFSKSLLNLSIIDKKVIEVAGFYGEKGELYTFDIFVYLSTAFSQTISPSLIVNGKEQKNVEQYITKDTKTIQIMGTYVASSNGRIKVEISLSPAELKEVLVSEIKMNVFGNNIGEETKCYHTLRTSDGLLVSKNINEQILYQIVSEKEQEILEENFTLLASGISHDFAELFVGDFEKKIFFFRVSEDGRLFVSDFGERLEKFICNNVGKVSVACDGGKILISMLKDNSCCFCEFDGENISAIFQLDFKKNNLSDVLCHYSKNLGKFCLVLSDRQNCNYVLFSSDAGLAAQTKLTAEVDLLVSTY